MNVPINDMYSQVVEALQNHHPVYWEGQMPRNKKPSIDGDLALLRQNALERFITTDQHAMAIVGLTKTKPSVDHLPTAVLNAYRVREVR